MQKLPLHHEAIVVTENEGVTKPYHTSLTNPAFENGSNTPVFPAGKQGKCSYEIAGHTVTIDRRDVPLFEKLHWAIRYDDHRRYVISTSGKHIFLHRLILGVLPGMLVDHRDGNGLNNCRSNLRVISTSANVQNQITTRGKSRFQGVYLDRQRGQWKAQIGIRRQRLHLGRFDSEEQAARAYDKAALKHFGEHAKFNFPMEVSR